eukprot:9211825-Pyramimonas_sp.AAC.1
MTVQAAQRGTNQQRKMLAVKPVDADGSGHRVALRNAPRFRGRQPDAAWGEDPLTHVPKLREP